MLRLVLNIGKNTSTRFGHPSYPLSDSRIMALLAKAGFVARLYSVQPGDTEDTAIAVVEDTMPMSRYSTHQRIETLAEGLHQDCIAAVPLSHTGDPLFDQGKLIGPFWQAWGGFDRTQFVEA